MSSSWRILFVVLVFLVVVSMALEDRINIRPQRPEHFHTSAEVKDYATKLRALFSQSGTRYGKRFAPIYNQQENQQTARQDMQSIYELLDNYEIM